MAKIEVQLKNGRTVRMNERLAKALAAQGTVTLPKLRKPRTYKRRDIQSGDLSTKPLDAE